MRHSRARVRQKLQFLVVKIDAVRIEHVASGEVHALHIRQRTHAELFERKALLVFCFAKVRYAAVRHSYRASAASGALTSPSRKNGEQGREHTPAAWKTARGHGSVHNRFPAVFQNFVRGLHDACPAAARRPFSKGSMLPREAAMRTPSVSAAQNCAPSRSPAPRERS